MNCTEFDQHWQRRLDVGAGRTPATLLAHLAECPRCRGWHRAWETLERAIDVSSAVDHCTAPVRMQPAMGDRVLAKLQAVEISPAPPILAHRTFPVAVRAAATDPTPVAVAKRRPVVRVTAFALAVLVLGMAWLQRPLTQGPENLATPGLAKATAHASAPSIEPQPPLDELPSGLPEGELASRHSAPAGPELPLWSQPEASGSADRPLLVKPLVGVVHNLTSLVLPGWPSVFNDSVGIPHYFDGDSLDSPASEAAAPPLPARLALGRGTEVPWPEPVGELLTAATESVQSMWDLASRW